MKFVQQTHKMSFLSIWNLPSVFVKTPPRSKRLIRIVLSWLDGGSLCCSRIFHFLTHNQVPTSLCLQNPQMLRPLCCFLNCLKLAGVSISSLTMTPCFHFITPLQKPMINITETNSMFYRVYRVYQWKLTFKIRITFKAGRYFFL